MARAHEATTLLHMSKTPKQILKIGSHTEAKIEVINRVIESQKNILQVSVRLYVFVFVSADGTEGS